MGKTKQLYQEQIEKKQDCINAVKELIDTYGTEKIWKELEKLQAKLLQE